MSRFIKHFLHHGSDISAGNLWKWGHVHRAYHGAVAQSETEFGRWQRLSRDGGVE